MTDEERYQELLDLLSRGLIRYAEKHGLLQRLSEDLRKAEGSEQEKEGTGDD